MAIRRNAILEWLVVLVVAGIVAYVGAHAMEPATKLSPLDAEIIRRTDLQIQLIQQRFQAELAPVVAEQRAVAERVCKAAKLAMADCDIDMPSLTVLHKKATVAKGK